MRLWHDVLATAARLAAIGRMGCPCAGCCWSTWRQRDNWTGAGVRWTARLFPRNRGPATGPNPTDRGKAGTKRHLVLDRRGTPLGVVLSGANRHDSMMSGERLRSTLGAALDAILDVRSGKPGRPHCRPNKLPTDKAYDSRRCRRECRARHHASHRAQRRGQQPTAGPLPLSRRAHACLDGSPPPSGRALRGA